jgi:hypothetical protein
MIAVVLYQWLAQYYSYIIALLPQNSHLKNSLGTRQGLRRMVKPKDP